MIRVPCSKCHRLFYVKKVEGAEACPHCSQQISVLKVPERRCAARERKEIPLVLHYHGKEYQGLTFDLSREGLGVKIYAGNHFRVKDKFTLSLNEELVRARVAWTRELPECVLAGVQRLN
jgi:hypothetical protein